MSSLLSIVLPKDEEAFIRKGDWEALADQRHPYFQRVKLSNSNIDRLVPTELVLNQEQLTFLQLPKNKHYLQMPIEVLDIETYLLYEDSRCVPYLPSEVASRAKELLQECEFLRGKFLIVDGSHRAYIKNVLEKEYTILTIDFSSLYSAITTSELYENIQPTPREVLDAMIPRYKYVPIRTLQDLSSRIMPTRNDVMEYYKKLREEIGQKRIPRKSNFWFDH